jgi:hypothetical protein
MAFAPLSAAQMIPFADDEAEPEPALLSTLPFSRTEF